MKYKLIKEYPGSPKLGTILTYEELQYCNWDEYYQKVVEKDYEILEVITNNGKFIEKVYNQDTTIEPYWRINSIKRLSDGEIFAIGDKIFPNNKIYKFELKDNNLKIWHCDISFSTPIIEGPSGQPGNCSWIEGINNLKKIKKPLFTTEDGVDIFDYSEDFYWVKKESLILCNRMVEKNYHSKFFIYEPENELYFSTKEKAEEYILMNKPCLSLNDINNMKTKGKVSSFFMDDLEKLVQQKLNK